MRKVLIAALIISGFMLNPAFSQEEGAVFSEKGEKLISIDVKDMEITDVIRLIADQSGLNIVTANHCSRL